MKIQTAKAVAQEIFDGVVSIDEFKEGESNECVQEIVLAELGRMIAAAPDELLAWGALDNPIWRKPKFVRTWGTEELDRSISPIEDNTYCLVAAKEKSGKTQWLLDVARKNAKIGGVVLFYSLEMTTHEMIARHAMNTADIDIPEYRTRDIPKSKIDIYNKAYEELGSIDGLILKGTGDNTMGIDEILREVEAIKPDLCIIDNLGLVLDRSGQENNQQAVISKKLISFTNSKSIPIILVHHMNKEDKSGHSSISGTQKLLNDPNLVLVLARRNPEDRNNEKEEREMFIKVKADRLFGKNGTVRSVFYKDGTYIDDWQPGFVKSFN